MLSTFLGCRIWRSVNRSEVAVSKSIAKLQHEHVRAKKELIERVLACEAVDFFVKDAIASMVTLPQHLALRNSANSGWQRRKDSGIRVLDSKER